MGNCCSSAPAVREDAKAAGDLNDSEQRAAENGQAAVDADDIYLDAQKSLAFRAHSEDQIFFDAHENFDSDGGTTPVSTRTSQDEDNTYASPLSASLSTTKSFFAETPKGGRGSGAASPPSASSKPVPHHPEFSPGLCLPIFSSPGDPNKPSILTEVSGEIDHLKDVIAKGLGVKEHKPVQGIKSWRPAVHAINASQRLLDVAGTGGGGGKAGEGPQLDADGKLVAGSSVSHSGVEDGKPWKNGEPTTECWSEPDSRSFQVRGRTYMKDRVKTGSEMSLYRLVAVDIFTSDSKIEHVAEGVSLPAWAHDLGDAAPELDLPPVIIFNLQLPTYSAGFWAAGDGVGISVVYYFQLPTDYIPAGDKSPGLELLRRFCTDGSERNGERTRDRLKLICRVANLDEWAVKAPLSGVEHSMTTKYSEKPILTRPQQTFYTGDKYLEIDLDVHNYAYLPRAAIGTYISRLNSCVLSLAFVVQGNGEAELPEQVLACATLNRVDWEVERPAPECILALTKSARAKRKN